MPRTKFKSKRISSRRNRQCNFLTRKLRNGKDFFATSVFDIFYFDGI